MLFNKGNKMNFEHIVKVAVDPACKVYYSHKFPTLVGTQVVERWSRKPLPPKNITAFLRGMGLKRYQNYMVQIDSAPQTHGLVYSFIDQQDAIMLKLFAGIEQTRTDQHYAVCPNCKHNFQL